MHKDIGRYIDYSANAIPAVTLAAATSFLATTAPAQPSIIIDRLALPRMYRSCVLVVGAELTAPAAFIGTVTIKVQDSAISSSASWTDYSTATQPAAVVLGSTSSTGFDTYDSGIQPAGTSSATGLRSQVLQPIDLGGARRFIQAVVIGSMGSSSSGTLSLGAAFVFGGSEELASTS
jgi:hypothetical protein